jgi:hypothetical protein
VRRFTDKTFVGCSRIHSSSGKVFCSLGSFYKVKVEVLELGSVFKPFKFLRIFNESGAVITENEQTLQLF